MFSVVNEAVGLSLPGDTVDLAPALVLGAQILLGTLLGLMGLFLADPIVAMIKVALEREAERNAGAANTKTAAGS